MMIKIKKNNIVKEIDDKKFPEYEERGFSRVGPDGNLIKSAKQKSADEAKAISAKVTALEKELAEATAVTTAKDERIDELEKELAVLKGLQQ